MAVRIEPSGGVDRYLRAFRAFNRNVKLFLVTTAFRGTVITALATVLNLYLYSLGCDARFIGLINAANSLAVLLVSVPMGYVADRVGRRKVLVAGGIAYPLSILGLALSSSTSTILAFNFLFGGCAAAYWVAGVLLLYASSHQDQWVQACSINFFLLRGLGPVAALLSGQVVEIAARSLQVCSSSSSALRVGMIFMAGLALIGALPYLFLLDTGQ